jgi:hypothetical protein
MSCLLSALPLSAMGTDTCSIARIDEVSDSVIHVSDGTDPPFLPPSLPLFIQDLGGLSNGLRNCGINHDIDQQRQQGSSSLRSKLTANL